MTVHFRNQNTHRGRPPRAERRRRMAAADGRNLTRITRMRAAGDVGAIASSHAPAGPPTASTRARGGLYRAAGKRLCDVALILVSAPVSVPVVGLLAFLVFIADGANPFFGQLRVGRGGRIFTMWKLRTMVPDAERKLGECLAASPEMLKEWARNQKLRNDPRITRLGLLLRKTSLDELPQLFNVLRGEMSLVGPRPMLPNQRELYDGDAYYRLRPGVTGLWQVSRRNAGSFAGRVAYDEEYDRQLSARLDGKLILQTFHVVVRATGV